MACLTLLPSRLSLWESQQAGDWDGAFLLQPLEAPFSQARVESEVGEGGTGFPGSGPLQLPDGGAGLAPVFSPLAFQGPSVGFCG